MSVLRRVSVRDEGQTLVELALALPVILLLLVGVLDFGRAYQNYTALGNAVREGARDAVVHGASSATPWGPGANDANVTNAVRARAVGLVAGNITVTSSWPSGNSQGNEVVVGATYTFRPVAFMVIGNLAVPLSASTRARIQR